MDPSSTRTLSQCKRIAQGRPRWLYIRGFTLTIETKQSGFLLLCRKGQPESEAARFIVVICSLWVCFNRPLCLRGASGRFALRNHQTRLRESPSGASCYAPRSSMRSSVFAGDRGESTVRVLAPFVVSLGVPQAAKSLAAFPRSCVIN